MKKYFVLFIAVLLCASMMLGAACAPKKAAEPAPAAPAAESQAEAAPAPEEAPAAAEAPAAEAPAAMPAPYQLGDKVEDFTIKLCDGTEVTLSKLLKEKKAVLINVWATYCAPCRMEFPFMQEAWEQMSDDIAVIAISAYEADSDEAVAAYKQELGLTLPMAANAEIGSLFMTNAFPTSTIIDRNGVVCFVEAGSIPETAKFLRLFSAFTGDDYTEPVLLDKLPAALPNVEAPTAEAMTSALKLKGDKIAVSLSDDPYVWPFIPADNAVKATNDNERDSKSVLMLNVTAEAGEALSFEYAVTLQPLYDLLSVDVDGEPVSIISGTEKLAKAAVPLGEAGQHVVTFTAIHSAYTQDPIAVSLGNFTILSAAEAAKQKIGVMSVPAKTLEGSAAELTIMEGEYKDVNVDIFIDDEYAGAMPTKLLTSDTLVLHIKLGKGVNDTLAYYRDNTGSVLINSLPQDADGYLYTFKADRSAEITAPQYSLELHASALDAVSDTLGSLAWNTSEAELDTYVDMLTVLLEYQGMKAKVAWSYADGSERLTPAPDPIAQSPSVDSVIGQYDIAVTDEKGKPVEGVTLQICDADSCQVAKTDENGLLSLTMTPYPYEIHVLIVPEGFARDSATYTLPETGGSLVIVLNKA